MSYIEVIGTRELVGTLNIQGAKNEILPILAASLLVKGKTKLKNCPKITDVYHTLDILEEIGCQIFWEENMLTIDASYIKTSNIPVEQVKKLRSSIVLCGALLGRKKEVTIPYPGGCSIGKRPIDLHLNAFRKLGIDVTEKPDLIECHCDSITGAEVVLTFPSVGATQNIVLASVLSDETVSILGAAKEPEIVGLCDFLNACGANIDGAGTDRITIIGVKQLEEVEFTIHADRIVAGTYIAAVCATGGDITLKNANIKDMLEVIKVFRNMGVTIIELDEGLRVISNQRPKEVPLIRTSPYPGFPTDMQSQIMAALTISKETSVMIEDIFEARYKHVKEFNRLGADILIEGKVAVIRGVDYLHGCEVYSSDLRGGAGLIIAGLVAKGKTIVQNCHYIYRGYEDICRDLRTLGAIVHLVD